MNGSETSDTQHRQAIFEDSSECVNQMDPQYQSNSSYDFEVGSTGNNVVIPCIFQNEILSPDTTKPPEDGYRWRKYGSKNVKNNSQPRSYYRCVYEGCPVRRQVDRNSRDPRFITVQQENQHNHVEKQPLSRRQKRQMNKQIKISRKKSCNTEITGSTTSNMDIPDAQTPNTNYSSINQSFKSSYGVYPGSNNLMQNTPVGNKDNAYFCCSSQAGDNPQDMEFQDSPTQQKTNMSQQFSDGAQYNEPTFGNEVQNYQVCREKLYIDQNNLPFFASSQEMIAQKSSIPTPLDFNFVLGNLNNDFSFNAQHLQQPFNFQGVSQQIASQSIFEDDLWPLENNDEFSFSLDEDIFNP